MLSTCRHRLTRCQRSVSRFRPFCSSDLSLYCPVSSSISPTLSGRFFSTSPDTAKTRDLDVVFSGIQPTGVPHLGNYLGALREWVKLQNATPASTKLIFSVVDLHGLTGSQSPSQLRQWKKETMAALIAVGLKPDRCVLFYQSDVPAHSELMWILSSVASMGYLSRMTQWKSKLSLPESSTPDDEAARTKLRLGLFSYPVLQAADVLIHRANLVPVGSDQQQHIEFARTLATSFNHHYGQETFPLPTALISPAKRVMSLKDPTQKMSKSATDPRSRILINDDRSAIADKIRLALTDSIDGISYDPSTRPGVSNLIDLVSHVSAESADSEQHRSCEQIAAQFRDSSLKAFKEHVTSTIAEAMDEIRENYRELAETGDGEEFVQTVAAVGAEEAERSAEETLRLVREATGLD